MGVVIGARSLGIDSAEGRTDLEVELKSLRLLTASGQIRVIDKTAASGEKAESGSGCHIYQCLESHKSFSSCGGTTAQLLI